MHRESVRPGSGRVVRSTLIAAVALSMTSLAACAEPTDTAQNAATPSAGTTSASPSAPSAHPFAGDKRWIAYQTDRTGSEGVWLIHPDGTGDHQIAANVGDQQLLPDWSPDGTRIAFTAFGGEREPAREFDLSTGKARVLFDCTGACLGDDEPAYSRDGRQAAVIRYFGPIDESTGWPADCSLWVGDLSSGKIRRVTSHRDCSEREYMPRWSNDGERLTYWLWREKAGTTGTAIGVVNADGSGVRRLTEWADNYGEPDWSPDGEWIVFCQWPLRAYNHEDNVGVAGVGNLFRMHPDGTGLEQLTTFTTPDVRATQPRYTPDGTQIVFTAVTSDSRHLWVIPADGGEPVVVSEQGVFTHGTMQPGPA